MPTATPVFNQEQFERFVLGGMTVSEYNTLILAISVGGLTILVIFGVVLWLNREAIKRRLQGWLN